MGANARVGIEDSGPRIDDGHLAATQLEPGKRAPTCSAESTSCGMSCSAALRRTPLTSLPSSGPIIKPPVMVSKCSTGIAFEFMPQLIRPSDDRDVMRMLEIDFANDPALAMRRAARVPGRKLLQAQHAPSAPRKMGCRRAAHGAESNDDDVERVGHAECLGENSPHDEEARERIAGVDGHELERPLRRGPRTA